MMLQPAANDTLGLSRYTEVGPLICLGMYLAVSEVMEAEGLTGMDHLDEFRHRIEAIHQGKQPCPSAATCQKFCEGKIEMQANGYQLGLF